MNTKNIFLAGLVASAAFAAPRGALAQNSTSGAMQGVVRDQATGEPMPGVTIVATSAALQGSQTAITEGDGSYKISNLPPGTYNVAYYFADITVEKPNVLISVNRVTPVYVKLDTAKAGGEKIIIDDKAPTIDPTQTNQGVTLDQDYTRNIPVPGRTFAAALGAAAGAQEDDVGVSFSGSTSLENQYVVDGVNTTGLSYGNVGSPIINEFIKEIEIITGGYQAEYGRATGGVVNVVTESGTNEFHGKVFTTFLNSALAASPDRPTFENPIDATSTVNYNLNFGFTLGGPIIKDKLWFYVGFAPTLVSVDTERYTKRQTDCRATNPDGTLTPCDPTMYGDGEPDEDANGHKIYEDIPGGKKSLNSQTQQYQFVSKINYAVSPEHQGQFTFSGQPSTSRVHGIFGLPSATESDRSAISTDMAVKWTSKFNNNKTEVETVLGWHRDHFALDAVADGADKEPLQALIAGNLGVWSDLGYESATTNAYCDDGGGMDPYPFIENCPDGGVGYRVGGTGNVADDTEQRFSGRTAATQRIKAAGNHEIKGGLDIEQNLLNKPRAFTGDAFYRVLIGNSLLPVAPSIEESRWVKVGTVGAAGFDRDCPNPNEDGDPLPCQYIGKTDVEGNTFNWAAYLRDSWQIMPNLTFNAGMRYEEQRLRYAKFIQGSPDPFTGQPRGKNAMTLRNMWAPRLGLIYDWTKEGRSKAYVSWGRFYESIPMDINDRSFGGETFLRRSWDPSSQCGSPQMGFGSPSGLNCGTDGSAPAQGEELLGGSGVLVATGIKPQYLDEVIFGVDYEVLEDLRVGVSYQNRRLGRVLEDVSTDNAATYVLANPGEWSSSDETKLKNQIDDLMESGSDPVRLAQLQNNLRQFQGIRKFDKPVRDYHAVQLTATKRLSNAFMAQGSYTYSRTQGNFPGLYSADNGQVDPNISSQYDLIELLANRTGPLPQDRPHALRVDGYYQFDLKRQGRITTGTALSAYSGTPINAQGAHYLYGQSESFLLPRGEMGRTPWNWGADIHLGYQRNLGRGMDLEVFTDLFSIFNQQQEVDVDDTYTFDEVNPVVGGSYEDLIWAKRQSPAAGAETAEPVTRNPNFQNPFLGAPFFARIGARLTF